MIIYFSSSVPRCSTQSDSAAAAYASFDMSYVVSSLVGGSSKYSTSSDNICGRLSFRTGRCPTVKADVEQMAKVQDRKFYKISCMSSKRPK
jgi:hypothetical protein